MSELNPYHAGVASVDTTRVDDVLRASHAIGELLREATALQASLGALGRDLGDLRTVRPVHLHRTVSMHRRCQDLRDLIADASAALESVENSLVS